MVKQAWHVVGVVAFLLAGVETAAARLSDDDVCLPKALVEHSDIVMLGMYGGSGTAAPYVLPGSNKQADVVAVGGRIGRPTILILAAYEATVWDLSALKDQPLAAVYASGFYPQGVVGTSAEVPVIFRHRASNRGSTDVAAGPCPDLGWPYERPAAMSAAIRVFRSFGKWPSDFYGSYAPFSFLIGNGELPPHAIVPDPTTIRTEGSTSATGFTKQEPGPVGAPANPAFRLGEVRGRRLFHMRWTDRGDVVEVEPELFGEDRYREQISRDD